ncbi:hypothetical protein LXL04_031271 [Taraxacum kok-saghyz]
MQNAIIPLIAAATAPTTKAGNCLFGRNLLTASGAPSTAKIDKAPPLIPELGGRGVLVPSGNVVNCLSCSAIFVNRTVIPKDTARRKLTPPHNRFTPPNHRAKCSMQREATPDTTEFSIRPKAPARTPRLYICPAGPSPTSPPYTSLPIQSVSKSKNGNHAIQFKQVTSNKIHIGRDISFNAPSIFPKNTSCFPSDDFSTASGTKTSSETVARAITVMVTRSAMEIKKQNPETDHKNCYGAGFRPCSDFVSGRDTNVGGVPDKEDGDGYEESSAGNKGPPATKSRGAPVAVVTDDRLNNHAGDWTTEPDEGRPGVGNTQELDVRGEEGELEGPSELDSGSDGGDHNNLPYRPLGFFIWASSFIGFSVLVSKIGKLEARILDEDIQRCIESCAFLNAPNNRTMVIFFLEICVVKN